MLDPADKTRLFYGPMEFELDWKTGHSRLKNLTWTGETPAGEVPIRVGKHQYLVNRPDMYSSKAAIVYLYEQDHVKLAAAVGQADGFDPLKTPEILASAGQPLGKLHFSWSDRNGNGAVEAAEVRFFPRHDGPSFPPNFFNRDLGIQGGNLRWQVKEFLDNGVPIYEEVEFAKIPQQELFRLDDGSFFHRGWDGKPELGLEQDGSTRWSYPAVGAGGHAFFRSTHFRPDECVSELSHAAHEPASQDPLGEFLVFHTYGGAWNIWTGDGLFAGPIFRDIRDPTARPWSMQEHERGRVLTDVTVGQEHFQAYVCRNQTDGKYYAVAGHNHISVLEILGLDQARRYSGKIKVTAEDIRKAQSWDEQQAQQQVYARAPVIDCYRLAQAPQIDGGLADWPAANADMGPTANFRIGFNDSHLFLAYQVKELGPMKNTGRQWDRLFKSGGCVDLQIGTDPDAPLDRQSPVAGDVRVLMSWLQGKPTTVLYRPVAPQADAADHWEVVSPVGRASFDEVRPARGAQLATSGGANEYTVEAAIPLAELAWKPADGQRLRMDWGLLTTGPDGNEVLRRIYWSNKAAATVADAPSEAVLQPQLWGYLLVHDRQRPSAEDKLPAEVVPTRKPQQEVSSDVDDILDSIPR